MKAFDQQAFLAYRDELANLIEQIRTLRHETNEQRKDTQLDVIEQKYRSRVDAYYAEYPDDANERLDVWLFYFMNSRIDNKQPFTPRNRDEFVEPYQMKPPIGITAVVDGQIVHGNITHLSSSDISIVSVAPRAGMTAGGHVSHILMPYEVMRNACRGKITQKGYTDAREMLRNMFLSGRNLDYPNNSVLFINKDCENNIAAIIESESSYEWLRVAPDNVFSHKASYSKKEFGERQSFVDKFGSCLYEEICATPIEKITYTALHNIFNEKVKGG